MGEERIKVDFILKKAKPKLWISGQSSYKRLEVTKFGLEQDLFWNPELLNQAPPPPPPPATYSLKPDVDPIPMYEKEGKSTVFITKF